MRWHKAAIGTARSKHNDARLKVLMFLSRLGWKRLSASASTKVVEITLQNSDSSRRYSQTPKLAQASFVTKEDVGSCGCLPPPPPPRTGMFDLFLEISEELRARDRRRIHKV